MTGKMELSDQYWLSEYQDLGQLNEKDKVHIVRNRLSGAICVRKYVHPEMEGIYQFLKAHPNRHIPRIYHCIRQDPYLVVIEEYLTGRNLEEMCWEHRLEEQKGAEIIISLCRALEPLHTAEPPIICRDLKADNVMLTLEGDVKLVDFDIARVYQQGQGRDTVMMGSEHYAAPEQFGFAQTDARTDIYAMGVLLNYLVTGSYPVECIAQGGLREIVCKCTALKPGERYQTVAELREDLERYLHMDQPQSRRMNRSGMNRMTRPGGSYMPPGFRGRSLWKMCIAGTGYAMITCSCFKAHFHMRGKLIAFPALQLTQFLVWTAQLMTVFYIFNYRGFRDKWSFPPVKSSLGIVRFLGYILLWFLFTFAAIAVSYLLTGLLNTLF